MTPYMEVPPAEQATRRRACLAQKAAGMPTKAWAPRWAPTTSPSSRAPRTSVRLPRSAGAASARVRRCAALEGAARSRGQCGGDQRSPPVVSGRVDVRAGREQRLGHALEGALGAEHTENAKGCVMLQALLLCGPDSRATMSRYDRAGFRSTAWHRLWRVVHTEQEGARTVARWSEQCVLYT